MEKYDWKDPKKELPNFFMKPGSMLIERDFWILLENKSIKLAKFDIDTKRFYIVLNSSIDRIAWHYSDIEAWAEVYRPTLPKPKEYALPKIDGWWITRRELKEIKMSAPNQEQHFRLEIDIGFGLMDIEEIADHWTFFNVYTNEKKENISAYLQLYTEFSSMILSNSKDSKDAGWTHVAPSRKTK